MRRLRSMRRRRWYNELLEYLDAGCAAASAVVDRRRGQASAAPLRSLDSPPSASAAGRCVSMNRLMPSTTACRRTGPRRYSALISSRVSARARIGRPAVMSRKRSGGRRASSVSGGCSERLDGIADHGVGAASRSHAASMATARTCSSVRRSCRRRSSMDIHTAYTCRYASGCRGAATTGRAPRHPKWSVTARPQKRPSDFFFQAFFSDRRTMSRRRRPSTLFGSESSTTFQYTEATCLGNEPVT